MIRTRAFVFAICAAFAASGASTPAQLNGGMRAVRVPLPTPTPSPTPASILKVPMANRVPTFFQMTVTSVTPAVEGLPFFVEYRLTNSGASATGTLYATFGGKAFDKVSPSVSITIPSGGTIDGTLSMNSAPATGAHALTVAFYDPPLKTANVVPTTVCDATSINRVSICEQKPLAVATQTVAVAEPSVNVRLGGTSYAKIAKPDGSDSSGLRSGYLFVQHNPGCNFGHLSHGNNGNDTFFATKALPAFTSIAGVDFVQFYPIGVKGPDGTPLGIGSYGAQLEYGVHGGYTVKWNNTCEAGYSGKALLYAISFRLSMPQGTDVGEQTTPLSAQPGLPEVPKGYSTIADASKAAAGQNALELTANGLIFNGSFDVAGGGGTFSAITNDDQVQIALVPPGTTTCNPPYQVVLNPRQTTTPDQFQQIYGSATATYPATIVACAVQPAQGRTQLGILVTFAPT